MLCVSSADILFALRYGIRRRSRSSIDQLFYGLTIARQFVDPAIPAVTALAGVVLVLVCPASRFRGIVGGTCHPLFQGALNVLPARNHRMHVADALDRNLVLSDCGTNATESFDIRFRIQSLIAFSLMDKNEPFAIVQPKGSDGDTQQSSNGCNCKERGIFVLDFHSYICEYNYCTIFKSRYLADLLCKWQDGSPEFENPRSGIIRNDDRLQDGHPKLLCQYWDGIGSSPNAPRIARPTASARVRPIQSPTGVRELQVQRSACPRYEPIDNSR